MPHREVVVWDPFIRLFHWLLAGLVITAWFIDEPLWLHNWLYSSDAAPSARDLGLRRPAGSALRKLRARTARRSAVFSRPHPTFIKALPWT